MSFDILLKIHLFSVAFWFGILGAELIIERNRTLSALHSKAVAHQHFWIDMLFETPAFVIVLITGLLMINPQQTRPFLLGKSGVWAYCCWRQYPVHHCHR